MEQKMRVAFIVHEFPILSETFVVNQAIGLLDRGCEVDIFTTRLGDTEKVHPAVKHYDLLTRTHVLPAVPQNYAVRIVQAFGIFAWYGWRYPQRLLASLNIFKFGIRAASLWDLFYAIPTIDWPEYDVIHAQFGNLGFHAQVLRDFNPGAKLVVMFRGFDISAQVRAAGDRCYDKLFKEADFFLTNCEFFRQRLLDMGAPPERTRVHYSGLDCEKFELKVRSLQPNEPVRIAATGRLVEKKGFEYSIRAITQLNQYLESAHKVTYEIMGDGPLQDELAALIDELGVGDSVRLLGWCDEAEIIEVLARSHLFVAPSVTAADGNQDAPINTLKEAMALGLPVVSTTHGGIPELVEHNVSGLLVPERNSGAIAQAIATLINNADRWDEMGRAGRAYVKEHYDLHGLNDRLVMLYRSLLDKSLIDDNLKTDRRPFMNKTQITSAQSDSAAQVTLVVVPRERFSCTAESLESLYRDTCIPFELVYVDGNSPPHVRDYLKTQSEEKGFELIRTEYYLFPNQARNMGLERVKTPYLVFVDNDIVVSAGWLEALVRCAEETQAAVVGPLMCQDEPVHEVVHFAGGESHIWQDKLGRRRIREKMMAQGKRVDEMLPEMERVPTELAEFHCTLVRTDIFDQLGPLDEGMLNTKEHLDFCMLVRGIGEAVYFEPASIVTYVPGPPLERSDLTFYMLRWSDEWTLKSLHHFRDKWDVVEDGYFTSKYKHLGWRRHATVFTPVVNALTFGRGSRFLLRAFAKLDHTFNRGLTWYHRRLQKRYLSGAS